MNHQNTKVVVINNQGLHHEFASGLANSGFTVVPFVDKDLSKVTRRSPLLKIIYKLFEKNSGNKYDGNYFIEKYLQRRTLNIIRNLDKNDVMFIISPHQMLRSALKTVAHHTGKKIAYHWDGIHRFPDMTKNDDLFDRVYVFDPADADGVKYLPTTNCYFDDPAAEYPKSFDLFYNTFYSPPKVAVLKEVLSLLAGLDSHISVRVFNEKEARHTQEELGAQVAITQQTEEYRALLNTTQKARVLLDIKAEEHSGLSFRFFEAMCYRCKVITNNAAVKNYDFYRPENIFVFDKDTTPQQVGTFLNQPYLDIPQEIRLRYYFPNWFKRMIEF